VSPTERVEVQAIAIAEAYAIANGYSHGGRPDKAAVGLVLVGMAIAAVCSDEASEAIAVRYRAQFPDAADLLDRWAAILDAAARR
jgi:hypothetical protein